MHLSYSTPAEHGQRFDALRVANGLPPFFARPRPLIAAPSPSPVLTPAEIEALLVELENVGSNDDAPAAPAPIAADAAPEVPRETGKWVEIGPPGKSQIIPRWKYEARLERDRVKKRKRRAKLKAADEEAKRVAHAEVLLLDLADLDAPQVDEAQLAREAVLLEAYLAKPGRSQGALRGKNGVTPADLMETRRLYLAAFAIGNPGYGELAKLFTAETGRSWSRDQAKRRVKIIRRLEEPGGPWSGDR